MAQYIDKAAVVAEIEKKRDKAYPNSDWNHGYVTACEKILSFLDAIEVKEVDLEKEIKSFTMSKELYEADSAIKAVAEHFFELGLNSQTKDMQEALRMEYEKGRADAIAEMQKEQVKEYLEGVKRVQNYKELTKFEKGFDRIAETYAHRKNKDGYNKPWYTKERAAEMLYWAKEELGIFNEK